jgi:hypothetical protein
MSIMLGELYRALTSVSVPEEQARKAAEEVAAYDNRIHNVEIHLRVIEVMLGFVIALLAPVFWKIVIP